MHLRRPVFINTDLCPLSFLLIVKLEIVIKIHLTEQPWVKDVLNTGVIVTSIHKYFFTSSSYSSVLYTAWVRFGTDYTKKISLQVPALISSSNEQ